jgi:hypothetical protein
MKRYRALLFLLVTFAIVFASNQVFASPASIPNAKNTPGVQATARATEKAADNGNSKNNQAHGKHEHFKGTVTEVNSSSITLALRDGSSVTIGLTSDTQIKFPGPKDSAPASIQKGMNINVQAIRDQGNNLVALRVMAIPGKPGKVHRVGIVTEYTAGSSITIQDKDGNEFKFRITGDIKLLPIERANQLAVGSRVTIIAPRDPASGGDRVTGIVIHPATP